MDTKTLILDAKSRFNHNAAKLALSEKYTSKLIVADQGGLWKADLETLNFLYNTPINCNEVVLIDTFNNPVKINALELYKKLREVYDTVMFEWYNEYKSLENFR